MPTVTLNVAKECRGPSLFLDCTINCFQDYNNQIMSKIFNIGNLGSVQLNFSYNKDDRMLSVQLLSWQYGSNVKIKVQCSELRLNSAQSLKDRQWVELGLLSSTSSCVDVKLFLLKLIITVTKAEPVLDVYNKFYKDTEFVDFKLCTADGSGWIGVHKLILSASSEVFKTMLDGEWKETCTGHINIEGVTLHTLKYLKDFMYMGVLPDIGLRPLLALAKLYLMNNLEKQCIQKIVEKVTSRNLYTELEFACENNIPELAFAVLCTTPNSTVHAVYESRKNKKSLETDW